LNNPHGVYVDGGGNVYVADTDNNRIQRWELGATSGTTVAGGNGAGAGSNQLNYPSGVFLDGSGKIYVADQNNNRIQRIERVVGAIVNTLNNATGGTYTVTATSSAGCSTTSAEVVVTPITPTITSTLCVGSTLTAAPTIGIKTLTWNLNGNIVKTTTNAGWSAYGTTVAGGNGVGSNANQLYFPDRVSVDGSGNVYIADSSNNRIQRWVPGASICTTVAGGNGAGSGANQLNNPRGLSVDGSGNVYVADHYNHRIQRWAPGATSGTTVAGGNGQGSGANQLNTAAGVYVDGGGNIYVADTNNNRIQRWAPGATIGTTVAGGNGQGSNANQLDLPSGVFVDVSGNIYVADNNNHRIQRWAPGATSGTTVAGGNGVGSNANQLTGPTDLYVDGSGNVYVADRSRNRIQRWAPGAISGTTVAGGNGYGSNSNQLKYPSGVYLDGNSNLYVADANNERIQRFAPAIVNTLDNAALGTYTVTATSFNGVSATSAGVVVSANNNMTSSAASSTPTLCINTPLANITHNTTIATGIGTPAGLPAGVNASWASNKITISGTPSTSGTFNYSIPLTGGCGSANATGTITVNAKTASAASSTPTLCVTTALIPISHTTSGATGIGTAAGLPAGVTAAWASNTINISGTPTVSGTFNYSIPLTGVCGSVNATGTITVNGVAAASSNPIVCINTPITNITHSTTGAIGLPYIAPPPSYVSPSIFYPTSYEDVGNVTISMNGNIVLNNTTTINSLSGTIGTASGPAGGYSDFTAFGPYALYKGSAYSFSLSSISAGNPLYHQMAIFIDYNKNGVFEDQGEQVYNSSLLSYGPHTETGTFTIPASAYYVSEGLTRMRIVCYRDMSRVNTSLIFPEGEFEDYSISIGGVSNYGLPAGLTAAWANNTITISGTPTATGTFNYAIPLAGGCGSE
jgi:sugar lactone lactonase YvrE